MCACVFTCVRPVVVLHGRVCEKGIVTRRPRALKGFVSSVKLHVVIKCPLLSKTPLTQFTIILPTCTHTQINHQTQQKYSKIILSIKCYTRQ